ncbi:hypothetical protein P3S67_023646 [Capsicum chacoense]
MKAQKFRDVYSIRSCWYQTKLWINPSLPQSIAFKSRLNAKCASNYERLSQTSSQQCYSITDELAKGIVPFKYINDLIVCLEEASYWIAAKIVCFDLDHGWSYMACNKCIIKVEQDGNSFFLSKMQFKGKSCSQV